MSDWINWKGGECPVHPKDIVSVHLKNRTSSGNWFAEDCDWRSSIGDSTITKYKMLTPFISDEQEQLNFNASNMPKQERFKNEDGTDWIDDFEKENTLEEFRGAMKFTIGKYYKRLGKKDSYAKEVRKIADYANRWALVEEKNS